MNKDDRNDMNRAVRDILLEGSEKDLREALAAEGEDFASLAARGRSAAQRALAAGDDSSSVIDLHRGLGALIRMLRRRDHLSLEDLAAEARVNIAELRCLEQDPQFDPQPRTVYQLEKYFKFTSRSLVILSGAVHVDSDVRAESVRFAASSESIAELSSEERKLLNRFVKFLQEHTDR